MKTLRTPAAVAAAALALLLPVACSRSSADCPDPTGPSTAATLLRVNVSTNVLFTGTGRGQSTITANLSRYDGTVMTNRTLYFEILDRSGSRINAGYFEAHQQVLDRMTDGGGNCSVNYYGPTNSELGYFASDLAGVVIRVTATLDGDNFVARTAEIHFVRASSDVNIQLTAQPNVLYATGTRPTSLITAVVSMGSTPIAGKRVFFDFPAVAIGNFQGGYTSTAVYTNVNGVAVITYVGPLGSEIGSSTGLQIRGQLQTDTTEPGIPSEMPQQTVYIHIVKQD